MQPDSTPKPCRHCGTFDPCGEDLLTPKEAALFLDVSVGVIYDLHASQKLTSKRVGKRYRFRRNIVEAYKAAKIARAQQKAQQKAPKQRPVVVPPIVRIAPRLSAQQLSWQSLRSRVYIRDRGICAVCQRFVSLHSFECGHILDRAMGGADTEDNCTVMCQSCNLIKPLHATYEEAMVWITGIGPAIPRREMKQRPKLGRPKRPNNAGSIYWNEPKKRWLAVVTYFGRRYSKLAKSKEEAETILTEMLGATP